MWHSILSYSVPVPAPQFFSRLSCTSAGNGVCGLQVHRKIYRFRSSASHAVNPTPLMAPLPWRCPWCPDATSAMGVWTAGAWAEDICRSWLRIRNERWENCREPAGNLPGTCREPQVGRHASIFRLILQNVETQLCTCKLTPKLWHLKFYRCHVSGDRHKHTHSAHKVR